MKCLGVNSVNKIKSTSICLRLFPLVLFNFLLKLVIYNIEPISAVQQRDSVIHIYTSFFKILFSIPGAWIYFPVLYSQTLFFIHSKCKSPHLLIPNSQSISLTLLVLPVWSIFFPLMASSFSLSLFDFMILH